MFPSKTTKDPKKSVNITYKCFETNILFDFFAVNQTMFLFGLSVAWSSTALPEMLSEDLISREDASWMSSSFNLAVPLGSALSSFASRRWGRKSALYLTTGFPQLVHWLLLTVLPHSVPATHTARIVLGVGIGAAIMLNPLYINEIAQDHIRGALGVIFIMMLNCGLLTGYVMSCFFRSAFLNAVGLAVSIVFYLSVFWLPETPVYQLLRGNVADAGSSLRILRGGERVDISKELEAKISAVGSQNSSPISVLEILSSKATMKGFLIGLALFANQQLSGSFVVLSNSVQIFQEAGAALSPNVSSAVLGSVNVMVAIVPFILVDRAGRRALLMASDTMMALSMVSLGVYQYLKDWWPTSVDGLGGVPLACLALFVFGLKTGLGPIPFVVMAEILPPRAFGPVFTVVQFVSSLLTFILLKFYYTMVEYLHSYGCYWLFAAFCAIGILVILLGVPETKCRPQEDIIRDLEGKKCKSGNDDLEKQGTALL